MSKNEPSCPECRSDNIDDYGEGQFGCEECGCQFKTFPPIGENTCSKCGNHEESLEKTTKGDLCLHCFNDELATQMVKNLKKSSEQFVTWENEILGICDKLELSGCPTDAIREYVKRTRRDIFGDQ